jgi:hypothetical protein
MGQIGFNLYSPTSTPLSFLRPPSSTTRTRLLRRGLSLDCRVSGWLRGLSGFGWVTGCRRLNRVLTHNNNVVKSAAIPTSDQLHRFDSLAFQRLGSRGGGRSRCGGDGIVDALVDAFVERDVFQNAVPDPLRGVALQVAFERQTLKPVFHSICYSIWV